MKQLIPSLLIIISLSACSPTQADLKAASSSTPHSSISTLSNGKTFSDYWYQGKAEITSYDLKQSRYGEVRDGHAVLIFVTEPFSRSKQVKLDNPDQNPSDKVNVLKLNFTRKFNTGVYPYSMMTSVFGPVVQSRHEPALKTTCTSQEWCGHTFTQLNRQKDSWKVQQNSYFESEGDKETLIDDAWLEDELWTTIRINPELLPVGEIDIIPSATFLRFSHETHQVRKAVGKVEVKDGGYTTYTLTYPYNKRTLEIDFVTALPYEIEQWKETRGSYFSDEMQITTGKLKRRILSDYWNRNRLEDNSMRNDLGLD